MRFQRKTVAIFLALVAGPILFARFGRSQDDPASEEVDSGQSSTGNSAPKAGLARGETPAAGQPPATSDGGKNPLAGEFVDQTSKPAGGMVWDSYVDFSDADGIARDVTSGIRVEDIVQLPSQYRYAAFGKADPFIPPMLTGFRAASLEIPIVSVLQRYSLDTLRIVGMWELADGERKALIMTPSDEGIVAKIGDSIGVRGGKIQEIGEKVVKVREFTLAPDGTRQFEDSELYLGDDKPDEKTAILMQATGAEGIGAGETKEEGPTGFLDRDSSILKRDEATTIAPPPPPAVSVGPAPGVISPTVAAPGRQGLGTLMNSAVGSYQPPAPPGGSAGVPAGDAAGGSPGQPQLASPQVPGAAAPAPTQGGASSTPSGQGPLSGNSATKVSAPVVPSVGAKP